MLLMCTFPLQGLGTSDESEQDLLHERGVYLQVSGCAAWWEQLLQLV